MIMMFENSTTFKPSDYGLFPGDQIDILCVGGGGAGWQDNWCQGGSAGHGGGYNNTKNSGGAGEGYGAGGGGCAYGNNSSHPAGCGGGSGYVKYGQLEITGANMNTPFAITVGAGGDNTTLGGSTGSVPGSASSFGNIVTAAGGGAGTKTSGGAGWNTGGDRYNASGGGGGGAAGWWPGLFISLDATTDGTRNGGTGGSAEGGGGGTLTAEGKAGSSTAGTTTGSNGGLTANRPSLGGGDDPKGKNGKGVVVLCWD